MSKQQGASKRSSIFLIYSNNLNVVLSLPFVDAKISGEGLYLCPLCARPFEISDAVAGDVLTLEHIIPQNLGGKTKSNLVLTCGACNNDKGTLEKKLASRQLVESVLKGNSSANIPAKYTVTVDGEAITLPANFRIEPGNRYIIDGIPKQSNPLLIDKVVGYQPKKDDEYQLHFQVVDNRHGDTRVGLLKSAYLQLFKTLGYLPIMSGNMESVRQQIANPKLDIIENYAIVGDGFKDEMLGVSFIYEPSHLRGFLVVFDTKVQDAITRNAILLPSFYEPGPKIYENLKSYPSGFSLDTKYAKISGDLPWLTDKSLLINFAREVEK